MVQTHQTQSLKTVAEAQHCTETLKQLIQECDEIEAGWEQVRGVREIVYHQDALYDLMAGKVSKNEWTSWRRLSHKSDYVQYRDP